MKVITYTKEQINELLRVVIEEALQKAADNAVVEADTYGANKYINYYSVETTSIINLFPEIYEKYKIN